MRQYAILSTAALVCLLATGAVAQEPIIYPAKGQNPSRTEQDKYQCYNWAKQQTGFDPMQPPPQPQAGTAQRSTPLRGAAGGAALGAIGGAIAGDAGKGAAIGAASGGLIGGVRGRREREQYAETQQAQTAAYGQARSGYNRAFGACMEGRGYTVK